MKKILLLHILAFSLVACGDNGKTDETAADEKDSPEKEEVVDMAAQYESLAQDACDCVNESTAQLSPEMVQVIVDSEGDQTKLQELMAVFMSENPTQAMEDAQAMQGPMVTEITECMERVEKKYDDVYSTDSDTEIQQKILNELKAMDDCKSSYTFMKMGMEK